MQLTAKKGETVVTLTLTENEYNLLMQELGEAIYVMRADEHSTDPDLLKELESLMEEGYPYA